MTEKHWQLSASGWVKVNVDGLVSQRSLRAAVGGVVRVQVVVGFKMVTGMADIFQIEARIVLEGLKLTWDQGFSQVELEIDIGDANRNYS